MHFDGFLPLPLRIQALAAESRLREGPGAGTLLQDGAAASLDVNYVVGPGS